MKWAERVTRDIIQGFGRESEGKRLRGRPRRRWEDNIKIYLDETGWVGDVK